MRLTLTIVGLILIAGAALIPLLMNPGKADAALLKEGEMAPQFSTEMVVGDVVQPVKLSDYRGKKVILYFYPKDDTPGCTKEACAFRDGYSRLQAAGIAVLGCSIDSADSHKAFIKKYGLPFSLLLDPDRSIARAYGADNGIPILGLDRRVTYVIGGDGLILKVYPSVDPGIHARQIIHDLGADHPPSPTPAASPPASAKAPSGEPAPQEPGKPQPDSGTDVE
jgi:thioredoxin-dependent peroxiredoxin